MNQTRAQKGLTLPEVLVALLIFALIAASSVYALRLGVDSRDQLAAADDKLKELQIARILMKEDLAQAVLRPTRDEFGVARSNMFQGGQVAFGARMEDDAELLVSFVRGGWINPGALAPRSALQRVEYIFRDEALIRRSYSFVDETTDTDRVERVLFDGLSEARSAFLNGELRGELVWADAWPVDDSVTFPRAVSITLEREDAASLQMLFWIGDIGQDSA